LQHKENTSAQKSVLSAVSQTITPIFSPMGISEENWPATVGIFTGVLAKEVVVGALNSLYTALAEEGSDVEEAPFNLWHSLSDAVATVPQNLLAIKDSLLDPIGLGVGDIASQDAAAETQGVDQGVFGAMLQRFDGQIGAFAYLLFVLMYFPCVATMGVIVREAGLPWALFVATWTTGIAYTTATLFYQLATFNRHPVSSTAWVIGLGVAALIAILSLRKWANRKSDISPPPILETN
jgi:ferrous iron transport protein B